MHDPRNFPHVLGISIETGLLGFAVVAVIALLIWLAIRDFPTITAPPSTDDAARDRLRILMTDGEISAEEYSAVSHVLHARRNEEELAAIP